MAEASERSYGWGKFQAWGALAVAVAQFVLVRFPVSLFIGVFFLYLWTGLLHKRRYGFVLMYIATGVAILAGLSHLAIDPRWDVFGHIVIAACFWGIPAAFYYPKRYREFGFRKRTEAPLAEAQPTATETPEPMRRELTDEEREAVLQHMRERQKPQEPTA